MKIKKCPYCGKRITYRNVWSSRRKGEFFCERCGKESKVEISNKIYLVFAGFVALSLAILAATVITENTNNFLFVILVSIPLLIFMVLTPDFVSFLPMKKYKNSMEARRAGIEYSDNILSAELENKDSLSFISADNDGFKIDSDVFNKIKAERSASKNKFESDELISDSKEIISEEKQKTMSFVPIIKNVSENHLSDNVPLKKIHSDGEQNIRRTHYIEESQEKPVQRVKKNEHKSQNINKYSSNRKF